MTGITEKYSFLPIAGVAEEVCSALAEQPRLIVTAPPGAGKSTMLPLAIFENLKEGKIIMLEPRRIAARQVAERMASMLGEEVGDTVGYRVRFDTRVSGKTRIEVVTEGVMERLLIDDPALEGVSVVIFDEYHERSLSADLSLALVREIQSILRPELCVLLMSATIDAVELSKSIDARLITSPGKCYEVQTIHCEDYDPRECASVVARQVRKAWLENDGNILVFLPGQAEILRCRDLLTDKLENTEVLTLYGMLPADQQRQVLSIPRSGVRRVVLASPIAETSLTISGITVVVDSGLYRTPVFEPSTGLSRLSTSRISIDMADQRRGRAGRLAPGACYRLWSKGAESKMKDTRTPEILGADLASMMLTLAACGETDITGLPWVTPPAAGAVEGARNLLEALGAVDENGKITPKGTKISKLPCHPRIANMLLEAGSLNGLACDIAALIEEKDPLFDDSDADISSRVDVLNRYRRDRLTGQWKRIDEISSQYRRLVKAREFIADPRPEDIGEMIASAYPERIAMRDEKGHYRLVSGGPTIALHEADDLSRHEFLAVASMGSRIFLAAPLSRESVEKRGQWQEVASWNAREGRAVVRDELRLGLLVLATRPAKSESSERIAAVIARAAPKEGLTMFDFNDDVQDLQLRISTVASWHHELNLPDVSTDRILSITGEWLPMYLGKGTCVSDLRKIDMSNVILGLLTYEQQLILDRIAPSHVKLPNGRTVRIRYRKGADAPVVSARLQDCLGLMKTPRVDDGKRPVLMELLSPGFKPVQLTQDMEGFWNSTYFEVRKELRRRYPKHKWPEDPLNPS